MELSATTLFFLSLISLMILVSLLGRKPTPPSSKKRRPPGPRCFPFIGSLLHLLTSKPQVALRDLAKKHGPVMYLRLGQVDAVVVSSPAAAQEVLRDKDITFASRPSVLVGEIFGCGNLDIAFAPYGAYWRTLRKLCTVELLSERKVRQFASVRDNETMSLVKQVRASGRGGELVNLGRMLVSCTSAITAETTFGEDCGAELREQFLSAIDLVLKISGGLCIGDLFPCLWFVDVITGLKHRLWRTRLQLDAVFDKIIAESEARREEKKKTTMGKIGDDDLLSVLLRIKDEGELDFPIGTTNIKAIVTDLFTAGTETTSSAAEWTMSELMRSPEAMAKAQAEVRRVFHNKNPQDHESNLGELSYTRMVIKEALRLHPVVPLLLPRLCRETCDVGGFEVTEGSRVIINAWAVARYPDYWHDAEEFRPERFSDGSTVDYKGTQFEYLPFGSGRRMCPGVSYGLAVLELVVARLLYYFDWSLPVGTQPDELDMDMVVGATARRKNQLHLVALPYNYKVPTVETRS